MFVLAGFCCIRALGLSTLSSGSSSTWEGQLGFFLFSPRFLKGEFTFFEIVVFSFPHLLDLPPGIDKNSEVPAEGSFG